ncbi:YjcZ family sporulation protein [Paenibacillus sp. GYB006]|nr:YjcZ family sporulation protein [Paenibacillus sp. J45TS6]
MSEAYGNYEGYGNNKSNVAAILVLFILLVIIAKAFKSY